MGAALIATISTTAILPAEQASATGYTASSKWVNVQVYEPVLIQPDDPCLGVGIDYESEGVYATLRPADNSGDIEANLVSRYDEYGEWFDGYLTIPDIPVGPYFVILTCREPDQVTVNMTYDVFDINVVENNLTDVTVDDTSWLGEATFWSLTPCSPYAEVEVQLYGGSIDQYTLPSFPETEMKKTVYADSLGNWGVAFRLHPDPAPNFVYPRGENYFFRAECVAAPMSPAVVYDSYGFPLGEPEYVALGDSYSSGTGSFNYDIFGGEACKQSTDSYSYYVSEELGFSTPVMGACHGAVTGDVYSGQISLVSEETYRISLTIGGNDAGFESALAECAKHADNLDGYGCSSDTYFTDAVSERMDVLNGGDGDHWPLVPTAPGTSTPVTPIKDVLQALLDAAPNASIYIGGYPELFGENTSYYTADSFAPGGYACVINTAPTIIGEARISYDDVIWLNDQAQLLNSIIQAAVNDLHMNEDEPVYYVAPTAFATHRVCDSGTPWLNDIDLDGSGAVMPESFHPNLTGITSGFGVAFASRMGPQD